MDFSGEIKKHLAQYKLDRLGIKENGIWKRNNKPYKHILPEELLKLNILELYRKEFWDYFQKQKIKRHKDFHHLNSSQAFCFNLFFPIIPLLEKNKYNIAKKIFNVTDEKYICKFEVILDKKEATNFDFFIQGNLKSQLFEIKYTESEFGKAKNNSGHKAKYEKIYKQRLADKLTSKELDYMVLLKHYQLLRNVLYINDNTELYIIFLFENEGIKKYIDEVVHKLFNTKTKKNIKILPVKSLVDKIIKSIPATEYKLLTHYEMFKEKYFI